MLSLGHIWASTLTWGGGELILKESEWTWMIGETNFSDGLNIFCERLSLIFKDLVIYWQ